MDFQQVKQEMDQLLIGTEFIAEYSYEMVEDDIFNTDTIDGVCIWKNGPIPKHILTSIKDEIKFDMVKLFINTWRQPLVDIREALNDETNEDIGCTSDVIYGILDTVIGGYEKFDNADVRKENHVVLDQFFMPLEDEDGCEVEII